MYESRQTSSSHRYLQDDVYVRICDLETVESVLELISTTIQPACYHISENMTDCLLMRATNIHQSIKNRSI